MNEDDDAAAWHQQGLDERRFRDECDEFHRQFQDKQKEIFRRAQRECSDKIQPPF